MSDIWSEDQEVSSKSLVALSAQRYNQIENEIKKLKVEQEGIENQLISLFPQEFGSHEKVVDNVRIQLEIGERYEWDTQILEQIFATSDALPDYVKKRLSVDKRTYARLNDEMQRALLPALTRKLGSHKLTVTHD
ncbi:hypothetical protein UFOVP235_42 [uncultured Caudovirales phage]|uniref:Uncharacterized protein n=1 Tax=uncultured Caudovirales phage TaxID=2100421 RepID=A0A6J7WQL9_9CAUD|nr:hypothetical protein UFOVP235_42 [uncultured Caudovirales phage]